VIRSLALMCAALVMTGAAAAKAIETRGVTFRGNRVQARLTLRIDPLARGKNALRVTLRTRRAGAAVFRLSAVAQLDVSERRFELRSFVVEARPNAALVEVAWRRRGIAETHRQYLLARVGSLKATPP
jgi:hypothetical protein